MTKQDFTRRFTALKTGGWLEYYYGFLWADRAVNKDLDKLAREVWSLYKDGNAGLVQRRDGAGCRYYAVKL